MNFIYFGSAKFSCTVLEVLCKAGFRPQLVVSQPDRPKGRHLKLAPTCVAAYARAQDLPLVTPDSIKTPEFIRQIKEARVDFIVVADYGKILPQAVLDCALNLPLALHPSLLPKYRGATPLNQALLNGDPETGVTLFKMAATMDSGPVLARDNYLIVDSDDVNSLSDILAKKGAALLAKLLHGVDMPLVPQDEALATYTAKLKKEDGLIDWGKNAQEINNLVRALLHWPVAYTFYHGQKLQILAAQPINKEFYLEGGVVQAISEDGVDVTTGCGLLRVTSVKPQGKGVMAAQAFSLGHKLKVGDKLKGLV